MTFFKTRIVFFLIFLCALSVLRYIKLDRLSDVCKAMTKKPLCKTFNMYRYFIATYQLKRSSGLIIIKSRVKPEKQWGPTHENINVFMLKNTINTFLFPYIIWKRKLLLSFLKRTHQKMPCHKRMLQGETTVEKKKSGNINGDWSIVTSSEVKKKEAELGTANIKSQKNDGQNTDKDTQAISQNEGVKENGDDVEETVENGAEEKNDDKSIYDSIEEFNTILQDLPPLKFPDPPSIPKDPLFTKPYSFGKDSYYALQKVRDYPFSCLCNPFEIRSTPEKSDALSKLSARKIHCSNHLGYCQYDLYNSLSRSL
ncbi:uncharacterized protein LOC128883037 isoform X1 [Hylaeus volcanicus]|uniref:uncharacterized protein LOC128883037 isoform X1 n=1 Tax=Hylaeus volcanicus TaxID=313075 RepID=UPI0023B7B6BE|nr:uncharacterized protein LOC128883037 isoform X1 [Hylaeus volcanicus]